MSVVTENNEHIEKGDIYKVKIKDRVMFAIRGDSPDGFGDELHTSEEDAVYWRDISVKRELEKKSALDRHEREAEEKEAKEREYVQSFKGFITSGRESGRRRQVLDRVLVYNGKPMSRKAIVENAYNAGAHVNQDNELEYPDGRFVNIGKIAAQYLNHLKSFDNGERF